MAGSLRLDLFNLYGDRIAEPVDLLLYPTNGGASRAIRGVDGSKRILIRDLPAGVYRLECDPPTYLPTSRFVSVLESDKPVEIQLYFAFDLWKLVPRFPDFSALAAGAQSLFSASANVLGYAGKAGENLFKALDDTRRAGAMNIMAKTGRTRFGNNRTVLSYLEELNEVRGDRFFVKVSRELREETKNSVNDRLFSPAPGGLHTPPAGFKSDTSFKSSDDYGNLQLTFFSNGADWVADIDIDDAAGLGHVFQVLRNSITGQPTNPFNIHQILFRHQELDSGFRLVPK